MHYRQQLRLGQQDRCRPFGSQGLTWKNYAEAYTSDGNLAARLGTYARKHVPFMSFTGITSNSTRCANIVDATQFDADIANNQVPDYVFFMPDVSSTNGIYNCFTIGNETHAAINIPCLCCARWTMMITVGAND